jgi:hypothetical protein
MGSMKPPPTGSETVTKTIGTMWLRDCSTAINKRNKFPPPHGHPSVDGVSLSHGERRLRQRGDECPQGSKLHFCNVRVVFAYRLRPKIVDISVLRFRADIAKLPELVRR